MEIVSIFRGVITCILQGNPGLLKSDHGLNWIDILQACGNGFFRLKHLLCQHKLLQYDLLSNEADMKSMQSPRRILFRFSWKVKAAQESHKKTKVAEESHETFMENESWQTNELGTLQST
jgi:hypothetical protein